MNKFALVRCVLVCCVLIGGCSGKYKTTDFVRGDVDFAIITKIAVLPFANNTDDKHAHQRIRNITITQLLAYGIADVVDRGIVDSVLYEEVIDPRQPIDLINLKRLGQRLNVQSFLMGSVDLVESSNIGDYPQVALTLRLVESQSGTILWQSSGYWTSESLTGKIFGIAPTDSYHVNLKLLGRMIESLAKQ
jgi:TolB-like protein